ncbi:MAG: lytic transglycosylase domain-containing protein [Geminicoccaceae bacterium]|nr:lytic transglycosylase domain-containing protein [Geminicoccaceae bacterium]
MAQPVRVTFLLASVLVVCAPPVSGQETSVRAVVQAAARRDWATAEQLAARLARTPLPTWVQWRRLREGDGVDFVAYREFLDRAPHWPEIARLQARAEELLDDRASAPEILAFFANREPRTAVGRLRLAEALFASGRIEEGRELLRRLWVADDLAAADERRLLERFGAHLRREDHERRLSRLLWDGRTDAARRLLPFVDGRRRAVAETRLALQAGGKTAQRALRALHDAVASDPGVAFDRIRLERARGRVQAVQRLLLAVSSEAERPALWWTERHRVVREALEAGDARLAYRLATTHRLPPGPMLFEAEWLAGWIALRLLQAPNEASRHFRIAYEQATTPLGLARAAYWAGRASAAIGKQAEAREWYERALRWPLTFYGQVAAAELGRPPPVPRKPPTPDAETRAAFKKLELVSLTELLCRAGAPEEVGPPIRRLAQDSGDDGPRLALVLELALACGRLDLATALGRAPVREGRIDPALAFPIPRLDGLLEPNVPVEPALLLAVARQESQFDPRAVSPAGARGLMQLMPATARLVARELGLRFDQNALLDQPSYNVRLGAFYLASQIERFGEPALALAAYNAGPGRVLAWLDRNGDPRGAGRHALLDWIERIPFSETRNYVQRVLEAVEIYRRLLSESNAAAVPLGAPSPQAGFDASSLEEPS